MTAVIILIFFAYLTFVGLLIIGWQKSIAGPVLNNGGQEPFVSVIIAARNEQATILSLLKDLQNQSYQNFEVIVVDDNSRDNTAATISDFTSQDPRFRLLHSLGEGKKVALTTGINASGGEIIVTTDGDCRVKREWLNALQKYFQSPATKMIFGGVKLDGSTFFSTLQAHEFLSLIGTGAATLWYGFPSMCNGANLAFRKAVFFEVGGYSNNFHIPSGDDEFLMRKIFQLFPKGIRFVPDPKAVVNTSASSDLKEFMNQRVRWAGKWKHNVSHWNFVLAICIFCFHLSNLLLPIWVVMGWISLGVAIVLFGLKFLAEWIFLKKVADFVDVPWRWHAFTLLQILYPIYAVWVGIFSTIGGFEWKGRKLNSLSISAVKKMG